MRRVLPLVLVVLSAGTVVPRTSPAWAHALLATAQPAVGSQSAAAPPMLRLRFTEPVEPRFCTIELRDAAGAAIPLETPRAEGARELTVAVPVLPPGTYTVAWRATSTDTHRTEGRYQFTIRP